MSVSSKMTSIADKIRALLGISGTMTLDEMSANLAAEKNNVMDAFEAIGVKGGTAPSSKVSGNLASAINTIPAGVEVKRKSGTITTDSNGAATVNCGFQPDLVLFKSELFKSGGYYYDCHAAVLFQEKATQDIELLAIGQFGDYDQVFFQPILASNGFEVTCRDDKGEGLPSGVEFDYVAIKYTA